MQNLESLKDTILQTIHEIEDTVEQEELEQPIKQEINHNESDIEFYYKLRERIIVLFEGLQSPNIDNIDKKLDLTINFLEYLLSVLDEKLSK